MIWKRKNETNVHHSSPHTFREKALGGGISQSGIYYEPLLLRVNAAASLSSAVSRYLNMAISTSDYTVLDISDWISTPAPFNRVKCGKRAKFSVDNSIVERRGFEDHYRDCVVYTREHLAVGQVWNTTVLNTTMRWRGGLVRECVLCFL